MYRELWNYVFSVQQNQLLSIGIGPAESLGRCVSLGLGSVCPKKVWSVQWIQLQFVPQPLLGKGRVAMKSIIWDLFAFVAFWTCLFLYVSHDC